MKGIIYCAFNSLNGKRYIGQTIQNLQDRKRNHIITNNCPYFHSALIKYGEENFEWKIIDAGERGEELDEKEKFWISFFQTNNPSYGYNLTNGGQNGAIMSQNNIRHARDNFIKIYSKEIVPTRKIRNVRCIETQQIFISAADAGQKMNIHKGHIASAASGTLKSAGGHHWEWCLDYSFFPYALYCVEMDKVFLTLNEAHVYGKFSNVKLGRKFKEAQNKTFVYGGYTFEKINFENA